MSEQDQVQKRAWVKNAAIVFLAVMLLLTLFSNTILNHSLPEVAVRYAESGSINAKIRGTGTVTANQSYEVSIPQTRRVESVAVQVGDPVQAGDLLFTLADSESSELEAAKAELDAMVLAYRLALIDTSSKDYAQDDHEIAQLQKKLQEAQTEGAAHYVSDAELQQAKNKVTDLEAEIRELTAELAELGEGSGGNLAELKEQRDQLQHEFDAAEIAYREEMAALREAAEAARDADLALGISSGGPVEVYMAALAITYAKAGMDEELDATGLLKTAVAAAYTEITQLEGSLAAVKDKIKNDTSDEYEDVSEELQDAQLELEEANTALELLNEKTEKWLLADESAESYQEQLNEKLFALAEQKKQDNKEQQKDSLNLADQQKKIAEQQQKVNELQADSVSGTVVATAPGVVTAINVTAGNETMPGEAMAVIEAQDLGYSLSFPVTLEQAKKVKVGDQAEVSNYYWGPSITATLTSVKNDPENPGQGKVLNFRLDGEDISAGMQLTLAIGQKSANYDVIVPNSALRTDANGTFVLLVTAKSTPLGNRYYANRVDVNVLATDDVNSAVSGGIASYDYVLTTSTKPIEPGQMVRLIEN